MLIKRKHRKRITRVIVSFILLSILNQVIAPTVAFALTSGPTAPEATSFEPIDTTDMVNPLTGDFTYNLPLLEVPGPEGGYPLSLSYHAGIQPNEDASWVGLGWTLNPGAITRSVNGFPDDWSGTNISRRDYWKGGIQRTYEIGVSVGLPGPVANLSFGLAFSQDTYQGFGVGMNMGLGIGLGKSGLGLNVGIGFSPFGDTYLSAGIDIARRSTNGISGSIGLGVSTNFESISANANGGVGYSIPSSSGKGGRNLSLTGMSISSNATTPSFSAGGISASASNSKAGNISTSSSGFSFGIPISLGLNINLSYSKIRYWSDETSNTTIEGSLKSVPLLSFSPVAVVDDRAYDSYGLLDPDKSFVFDPDPVKGQGGAFPDFDMYSVSGQGITGNIRPYCFQSQTFSQNRKDNNNTRLVQYFQTKNASSLAPKSKFRFVNDFSNSYRQMYPDYSMAGVNLETTPPPFDNNPQYGNNDGNFGFNSDNNLAGSKSIEYFTTQLNGSITGTSGSLFIEPVVHGLNRSLHKSGNSHIEGFKITNSTGVTYHYNLPAYSYDEEVYQEKIGGNSSNRQIKTEGYAYTWYLTSITGADYVDRNNNQKVDEGDWGYWINFEYGKWSDSYVWRNPSEGFHKDEDNEFQNVSMGKKEIYYLNAIRTRSHIAIFEKEVRFDARGASASTFVKGAENRYLYSGGFDETSAKTLRLDKIYLLNAVDANIVLPGSSGTGYFANMIDKSDINSVGRNNVESKAIRVIDFRYDYSLCKGTANSFSASTQTEKFGKLTLAALNFRGVGGANLTPPVEFDYQLSAKDLKTAEGSLSTLGGDGTFVSQEGTFELGDLVETSDPNPIFCGTVISKTYNGSNFSYVLRNSQFSGAATTKQLRTTKNPPYYKEACDMWGMYKSDYKYSINENLSRLTSELSNKSVDVWSLRKIKTSLGSEISVNYEGDTYSKCVLNPNLSLIINGFTRQDRGSWIFNINTDGRDLSEFLTVGDVVNFVVLRKETVYGNSSYEIINAPASVLSVTNNQIHIDAGSTIGATMDGSWSGPMPNIQLITGNVIILGKSKYFGGGIRVKSLQTDDLLNKVSRVKYLYNSIGSALSSGVTSYEPSVFDVDDLAQFGSEVNKKGYRYFLHKDLEKLYRLVREVPSPGVMYEYVTIENEVQQSEQASVRVPGKTTYQYEVFRDNMVGTVNASPGQFNSSNGKSQYTKNIVLKKFASSLGALKKTITYDSNNKKISEITNHYLHDGLENLPLASFMNEYEQRLSQFFYQGLIKERYSEVKEVRQDDGSYHVLGTFSAKEEYPAVPLGQTTKDYVTGVETGTENLEFDFYSGALTKMIAKDAYGNKFLTEIVPAYRVYSGMGLKDMSTLYTKYSNMLTQEASKTIYKVDASNQNLGIVSASAQTWSNNVRVDDENGDPTTDGQDNIWRNQSSYQWLLSGTSTNNITPIGLFTPFNYNGSNSSSWKKTGEVTRYNVFSAALEVTDINNHYAASRMGYKNSKVTITASPARYMEIAYTGAEDAILPNGKFSTGVALGSGSVDNSMAHTGSKSISLAPGATGITYEVPLSNLDPVRRDYQLAVWVRSSADISGARLFYQIDNQSVQFNSPSFQKTAAGWYLLEMRIPASALVSGNNLIVGCKNISGQSVVNFDDFRFQPFNAPTTSYVYDNFTGQPTYILDNNNLYVKYEYDAIGRLTKIYKEVLGKSTIPVIKEIAYNYSKPVSVINDANPFYARIEFNNYDYDELGDEYNTVDTYADVYIRFYSDVDCSIPYNLPSQMDFTIAIRSTWSNYFGSDSQTDNYTYTALAGYAFSFLGKHNISTDRYWFDPYFGYVYDNMNTEYSLIPLITDSYTPLPTIL